MADETLRFDIIGRDQASGAFSRVAGSAKDMGDRMNVATRHALVLDEALKRQSTAARVSADATLAAAKADKILADAEEVLSGRAIEADLALRRQAAAAKKAGEESKGASGGVSALAGGGGIAGGGMGALVGAGVALSPVLVTVGAGLGGLGLAAAGAVKPIENAAQKTGGLSANMKLLNPQQQELAKSVLGLGASYHRFQAALQPQVLGDFNKAIGLAGHLMHDLEPVSQATGKALGGVLGQIDAEFQSGTWQQFFGFMAKTAGPDLKQLGGLFTALLQSLPPLLMALQPLATSILTVATDAAKAIGPLGQFIQKIDDGNHKIGAGAKSLDAWAVSLTNHIPGYKAVNDGLTGIQHAITGQGSALKVTTPLQAAAAKSTAAQTAAVNALNAAMTINIAKTLTLEGDEVSWKQAQQAATTAINQNHHALDGNSASALAARAAIISATTATIKFADDSNTSTGALHRASGALQDQIHWLEKHAGKSRIAREEIKALREEEAKIKREIDQRIKVTGTGSYKVSFGSNPVNNPIGKLGAAAGMYVRGGTPGRDSVLVNTMPGELVVPTHMVNAGAVDHLRGSIPGFAAGGIVPSYSGGVPGLGPWAAGNAQATLRSLDHSVASALSRQLQSAFSSAGGPASYGVTRWAPDILRALAMLGQSSANLGAVEHRMQQESGGNPFAINLTDSNAAAGDPSRGLMQTIGSTFARYHSWSLPDNIYNPMANIFAGLNYAVNAYPGRSLSSVMLQAGGYDHGGYLPQGLSLAYNGTGKPEPVGAAAGGVVIQNLNITLPPGSDREQGRRIVEAIRKYEQGSGKSWRS